MELPAIPARLVLVAVCTLFALSSPSSATMEEEADDLKNCPKRESNWVNVPSGFLPKGAFLGGTDPKCMLYVGRTTHDGELLPGKICQRYGSIYIAWKGREHIYNSYQFLTGSNFEWISSNGTHIPSCAVEGGKLKDGTPVYIGRTFNAGALDIGRVNPVDGTLYIPYYGKEYGFPAYELLVFKSKQTTDAEEQDFGSRECFISKGMTPQWEDAPTGDIATERLVATNNTKCNYYVGRATHEGDVIPGKFIPEWRNVYIAWGGDEIALQKSQLLIGNNNYEWIPATRGRIPSCIVKGGKLWTGHPFTLEKSYTGIVMRLER